MKQLTARVSLLAPLSATAQGTWKSEHNIEIVVGATAGAGTDKATRMMRSMWQKKNALGVPSIVSSKWGGGVRRRRNELEKGSISNNYLNRADTRKYLDVEYADIRNILIELGPAKSANKP